MQETFKQWIERNQDILVNAQKLVITLRNDEVENPTPSDFMETVDSGVYVAKKVPYLLTAYDDECRLKNNPKIQIVAIKYTTNGIDAPEKEQTHIYRF